jgi:hypothetical protein
MAIAIKEEKKPINWLPIVFVLILIVVIGILVYYLFLAPTPGIEIIAPTSLKEAGQILSTPLDIPSVRDHRVFKTLLPYVPPITVSNLGRENPFTSF